MRRARWPILSVLLLASPAPADELPARLRVLALGDSITLGQMSGAAGTPYTTILAERLGDRFDVAVAACGMTMTIDWIRPSILCTDAFATLAAPRLPADLAVVLLGTNDAVGNMVRRAITSPAFARALRRLIDSLRRGGVRRVVLMTPPPRCSRPATRRARVLLVGFRERIREICAAEPDVDCGPDLLELLDPHLHFDDCNPHPNAAGHALIADALAESLRAIAAETPVVQAAPSPAAGAAPGRAATRASPPAR